MMDNMSWLTKNKTALSILSLIIISALAYLPLINQLGYTHDDWYLMPSARAEGAGVFREIFSVDRPGRALVMIPAYKIFGENPLPYNLSAYVFRVLGALALLWTLNLLWKKQRAAITAMALLFLIYPGFLSQTNGIDYQSHIVGLATALTSIACTLQAITSTSRTNKIFLHIGSIILAWLYLGQMEWYIGFEFFRWAGVFLLSTRAGGTLLHKIRLAVQSAYPSLAGPGLFLIWRIFSFHSARSATDVDLQFSNVRLYPLQTIYHWVLQVAQDFVNVTVLAWKIPLSQLTGYIQTWGIFLALLAAVITFIAFQNLKDNPEQAESSQYNFQREAILLGLFTISGGLLPIAMVNRGVSFPVYSRYSLVASVGVAILLPGLLMLVKWTPVRNGLLSVFCLIAVLTHHANAVKYVQETSASDTFWWQVSWRVPQFEKSTTLIANYPVGVIEEDYFVWGPASLIYYPEKQNPKSIQPGLYAAVMNADTVAKVQAHERQEFDNRKNIITYKNYRNIVILTQPTASSCVHVLNGNSPEYPQGEWDSVLAIGSFSKIDNVNVDAAPHTPSKLVFGPEPAHGWCYYYQKADLARQRGDWQAVLKIGKQVADQNLVPQDLIEWIPFLQAYAITGDTTRLKELASIINANKNISQQACKSISVMLGLSANVMDVVHSLYCAK